MSLAKELFSAISDVGKEYKIKNKETSVVKLLDKTINTLNTALKAMDKFLKNKGIDVEKLYESSKSRGKSLLDKVRTTKSGEKVGVIKGLMSKGKDIKSSIQEQYTKFTESNTAPPDQSLLDRTKNFFGKKKEDTNDKDGLLTSVLNKFSLVADKITNRDGKDLDQDGVEEADWSEKSTNKANKRKSEIEAEKKAVLAAGKKKKKKDGFLSSILSKIGSLGGLLSGAIWNSAMFLGKGFARATWWVGKKLLSGIGGMFTRLVPSLAGSIASGLQSVIGSGLMTAGRGLLSGAGAAARAALPFAGSALGLAARGAAMLLTGPVGWAVAAGTVIYGGYKLYKYLTRNDIAEDISGKMHLLRLQTYGFGHNAKEHYSKAFDLDAIMSENITFNAQSKTIKISEPTAEQTEKIYELFGVTENEKERKALLGNWFVKRYLPGFHSFMQALYSVNSNFKIDELDDLEPKDIKEFLLYYKLPTSAFTYTQIPYFEQPETTVSKADAETTLESIKDENNKSLKMEDKTPTDRMAAEIAKKRSEEKTANAKKITEDQANKAVKESLNKAGIKTRTASNGTIGVMKANASEHAEAPPTGAALLTATVAKTNGQIPKAEGPLTQFDGTLAGISTKLKQEAILNLDPDVLNLFAGMAREYNALTGKNIVVNEAFRSYAEQEALYRKYGASGRAAPPGKSLHEFGLAIDINSENTKELEKLGLLRKYGFTVPVGGETWHIEPIGVSLDPNKAKHDLGYRKVAISTSVGNGGGGYGMLTNSAKYKRDIALQRNIYESKISEVKPETPGEKQGAALLTAGVTQPTTNNELVASANAKSDTTKMASAPVAQEGGALSLSNLMAGTAESQTSQEPEANKDSNLMSNTIAGYGNSVGTVNPNMNVANYGDLSPVEAIKQASKMTGVPEETLMTFGKLESGLRANVSAGTSSAAGLFQMTDSTWSELLNKHGSKYGLNPLTPKTNALANALMAAEYAKSNLAKVSNYKDAGLSQESALYLTHHFGPSGGKRLIDAYIKNPDAPVNTAVSQDAYNSNKAALGNKTIAGYIASLDNKFAVAKNTDASAYKGSGAVASTATPSPSISSSSMVTPSYETSEATNVMASYTPVSNAQDKPTISSSAYDVTRVDSSYNSSVQQPSSSVTVDTSNLELIMNNQLTTLTQIATVLGTINDKLDFDKLMGLFQSNGTSTPSQPTPSVKQVPHTGVSMGKKIVT